MFLNYIKKLSFKDWFIIILCCLCIFSFLQYKYYKTKYNNSVIEYDDSLYVYKNKLGESYKMKNTYIYNIDQLKSLNKELYDEVKSLKDNPILVTKTYTNFYVDTVFAKSDTIVINKEDSIYDLQWSCIQDTAYYSLSGSTKVKSDFSEFQTIVKNLQVKNDITLDLIDNGKNLQVIAKSNNPYVNIDNINSIMLDPTKSKVLSKYYKQKKWAVGPYIGVGINTKFQICPTIGVGLTYGIIHF